MNSFRCFWTARVASVLAFQMVAVAVGWQVYDLTASAFALGFIGAIQFLPTLVLVLATGHVADRFDRRTVTSVCQLIEGLMIVALVVLLLDHALDVRVLFAVTLAIGITRAFENPSMTALLPNLVSREALQRATASSTSAIKFAQIAGPALGGILYALGPLVVYAISALLMLVAATLVQCTRPMPQRIDRTPVTLRSLLAGAAFVRADRFILGALSLDLFAVIFGGATALLPIYAKDILATGPWGLGLLRAAPAAGAIIVTVFLSRTPLRKNVGPTLFATVAAYGVATIAFAISHVFVLSLLALALAGLFDAVSQVIRTTLVQLETPDDVRGRVTAVNSLFTQSSGQLGQLESGLVAGWYGPVVSALTGGLGTVAIAGIWMVLFPEIARIDSLERRSASSSS
jgi:MFS family permease